MLKRQVSEQWDVVTDGFLRCKALVGAATDDFFKADGHEARDMADLDFAKQFDAMMANASTVDDLEVVRVEYLKRFIQVGWATHNCPEVVPKWFRVNGGFGPGQFR